MGKRPRKKRRWEIDLPENATYADLHAALKDYGKPKEPVVLAPISPAIDEAVEEEELMEVMALFFSMDDE
jgi:hypothetical protein